MRGIQMCLDAKSRNILTKTSKMGKPFALATLIVSALCFSFLLGLAHGHNDPYNIQGRIYCDPCRLQYETTSSLPLKGVTVKLECRTSETGSVTYSKNGVTDQSGIYSIEMQGNHEKDHCEITTDQSTHSGCHETMASKGDRIAIKDLIVSLNKTQFVRPLGFMTKQIDNTHCSLIVKEYDLFNMSVDD